MARAQDGGGRRDANRASFTYAQLRSSFGFPDPGELFDVV
jgi:hypothetical protein